MNFYADHWQTVLLYASVLVVCFSFWRRHLKAPKEIKVLPKPEEKVKPVYSHADFIEDMVGGVPLDVIMEKCRAAGGVPRRPVEKEVIHQDWYMIPNPDNNIGGPFTPFAGGIGGSGGCGGIGGQGGTGTINGAVAGGIVPITTTTIPISSGVSAPSITIFTVTS